MYNNNNNKKKKINKTKKNFTSRNRLKFFLYTYVKQFSFILLYNNVNLGVKCQPCTQLQMEHNQQHNHEL